MYLGFFLQLVIIFIFFIRHVTHLFRFRIESYLSLMINYLQFIKGQCRPHLLRSTIR